MKGKGAGSVTVSKTFDPDRGVDAKSAKGFSLLKGASPWTIEVVGKITSSRGAFGQIDLYYDNLEELLADPKIVEAFERAEVSSKRKQTNLPTQRMLPILLTKIKRSMMRFSPS